MTRGWSRSRRRGSVGTATGSSGSIRSPARPATSRWPPGCAAFPYIDDFLPAGTVASLERLGEILAGGRGSDTRRGSEAAAHVAPSADAVRTFAPPAMVVRQPADPFSAQPLR